MATYHFRVKNDTKPNGTKVSAKGHVDYILREDATSHADYINREGTPASESDCVFKAVQLPSWADGSAQKFFEAAARYEDKGNRRFKEIEFSLPNELTLEQNREIVDRFITAHLSRHYYAYAIHDKIGALSNQRHPHVHIMFSERLIDDVEIVKERPAYRYFRRAAKPLKGEALTSFERRSEHGAPKDKHWHDRNFLIQIREDFARIQNEVLKKHGYAVRVDHRTLKVQKEDAERNGDSFLAEILDRSPELYIGITSAHDEALTADLKRYREIRQQKFDLLFQVDFREKILAEEQIRAAVRQTEILAWSLIQSENYTEQTLKNESLALIHKRIRSGLADIKKLKKQLVKGRQTEERSQAEYLTKEERILLCEYKNAVAQKFNLENLLRELIPLNEKHTDQVNAFAAIESGIRAEISSLRQSMAEQYPEFKALEEKMQTSYRRRNIQLATHFRLQENLKTLTELKKSSDALLLDVQEFEKLTTAQEIPQSIFSLPEVQENLRRQYLSLKSNYERVAEERNALRLNVISPARALTMARNIFVHGAFKTLRAEKQKHEKATKIFERQFSKFQQRLSNFENMNWTNSSEKFQEQYQLTRAKLSLEASRKKLTEAQKSLTAEAMRLENLCKPEQAQQQIALIAAGILRKNLKVVHQYENTKTRSHDLFQKLQQMKKRMEYLKAPLSRKLKPALYCVISSESSSSKNLSADQNSIAAIIADALGGEKYAVPLVAYSSGNSLEMDKSWELLSELDKDEILQRNNFTAQYCPQPLISSKTALSFAPNFNLAGKCSLTTYLAISARKPQFDAFSRRKLFAARRYSLNLRLA